MAMSDLTRPGDALEGDSLEGQSRDPIIPRGLMRVNGLKCYKFSSSFDVKSKIKCALSSGAVRLDPNASVSCADQLLCERATILSLKMRYSKSVSTGSATHKANFWAFPQQAIARIDMAHQQIENARAKRLAQMSQTNRSLLE